MLLIYIIEFYNDGAVKNGYYYQTQRKYWVSSDTLTS